MKFISKEEFHTGIMQVLHEWATVNLINEKTLLEAIKTPNEHNRMLRLWGKIARRENKVFRKAQSLKANQIAELQKLQEILRDPDKCLDRDLLKQQLRKLRSII